MKAQPHIQLESAHYQLVLAILTECLPNQEVYAFGSRVTGKARRYSDLDLVVIGEKALSLAKKSAVQEAFSESDLPWKVDLLDWHELSDGFREAIKPQLVLLYPSK